MPADRKRLDKIHIRDLCLRCIIGLGDEERRAKQDVLINLTLYTDLAASGQNDRIADTVDYEATVHRVMAMVEPSSCRLVEHPVPCVRPAASRSRLSGIEIMATRNRELL